MNMNDVDDLIFIDAYEDVKVDPKFILVLREMIKLGKDIIDKLGPDYHLFLKYEELICQAEGMKLRSVYKLREKDQ